MKHSLNRLLIISSMNYGVHIPHNLFTFQNSLKFREKKLSKMFTGDMLEII